MARKYSKAASKKVEKALHERKEGKLKSGPGGKGGKVKSRKQAIAIGLSEARAEGKKVPKPKKKFIPREKAPKKVAAAEGEAAPAAGAPAAAAPEAPAKDAE